MNLDTMSRFYYLAGMGRPLRIEYPGALYHITSRYHVIVETPKGDLVKIMHGINGRYTGYFNRKYRRSGHLFQGRYKGILVDKDAYLLQLSRYVHLNPVRAKIVERPEQYGWSSYPGFIGRSRECSWVAYSWIFYAFGTDVETTKKKYQKYTEESFESAIERPAKNLFGQIILGGKDFVEKIKGMLREKSLSSEFLNEGFPIGVIPEDLFPFIPPAGDMVNSPLILNAQWSCHNEDMLYPRNKFFVNNKELTPFTFSQCFCIEHEQRCS